MTFEDRRARHAVASYGSGMAEGLAYRYQEAWWRLHHDPDKFRTFGSEADSVTAEDRPGRLDVEELVMRKGRALVVAIAVTALSACGSHGTAKSDGSGAKVASLVSGGPSASASAASTRPRYRFDMTAEDEDALWEPYNKCLKEHGYTRVDAKKAEDAAARGRAVDSRKAAELKECEERSLPLPEWEKDPANPRAGDFARAVTKCLKVKGIKMEGDSIADSENVARALDASGDCEREVAAGKY